MQGFTHDVLLHQHAEAHWHRTVTSVIFALYIHNFQEKTMANIKCPVLLGLVLTLLIYI